MKIIKGALCTLLCTILIAALAGCGGGNGGNGSGSDGDQDNNPQKIACYWRVAGETMERITLPGVGSFDAEAKSIAVANGIVYTAGSYYDGKKWIACYWEGTARRDLETNVASRAESITVKNGKLFIAGGYYDTSNRACYWTVNGSSVSKITLPVPAVPDDGQRYADAFSIAVASDETVYTAGFYINDNGDYTACYWKTTDRVDLTENSVANSIFISGTNVYVAGTCNTIPCYWMGGIKEELGSAGGIVSIIVVDSTVYAAVKYCNPSEEFKSCYWKGNERFDLQNDLADLTGCFVSSIALLNQTVYTAGYIGRLNMHNKTSCYWKDRVPTKLPNDGSDSEAYSIVTDGSLIYIAGYF
jgi:hypothetical protein